MVWPSIVFLKRDIGTPSSAGLTAAFTAATVSAYDPPGLTLNSTAGAFSSFLKPIFAGCGLIFNFPFFLFALLTVVKPVSVSNSDEEEASLPWPAAVDA